MEYKHFRDTLICGHGVNDNMTAVFTINDFDNKNVQSSFQSFFLFLPCFAGNALILKFKQHDFLVVRVSALPNEPWGLSFVIVKPRLVKPMSHQYGVLAAAYYGQPNHQEQHRHNGGSECV